MGILFADKKEPAFAGLKMCQSLGACTNFLTAKLMCTAHKIYLLMAVLVVAVIGYVALEIHLRCNKCDKPGEKKQQPVKV